MTTKQGLDRAILIRLPSDVFETVQRFAAEDQRSIAGAIRRLISRGLAAQEKEKSSVA